MPAISHAIPGDQVAPTVVSMHTHKDCKLAMGYLPWFTYDARSGSGPAVATRQHDGRWHLTFNPAALVIPPLNAPTTRIGGALPLPSFMTLHIKQTLLEGWIDLDSGEVQLQYDAVFTLHAPFYSPPALHVSTTLTTETLCSGGRVLQGKRLDGDTGCVGAGGEEPGAQNEALGDRPAAMAPQYGAVRYGGAL